MIRSSLRPGALFAALILAAACQPAAPVVDQAAEEATVLQFARDFAAAEASNDDDAVMAFWWDDAVMQPPNAPTIQGAEAIRAMYETVTFESMEVGELTARVSGDLAAVWGPFAATVVIEGVGRLVNDNKFIVVLERRDGVWKAIENTWNSNLPPMAPSPVEE
jgi:ketosteroid isomerase-like protein